MSSLKVRILGGAEVAALLAIPVDLLGPLEAGLRLYSRGATSVPPRVAAIGPAGLLAAMPARVPGCGLAAKLVSVFPGNTDRPSHQGLVALFDEETGTPLCLMDACHLTASRTAAVSALSMRLLARGGSRVLAVLGSGQQSRAHLRILPTVLEVGEVRIAARSRDRATAVARDHPGVQVMDSMEAATRGADVVACCTGSAAPIIDDRWLAEGAHVVSVGTGRELSPATIGRARTFVEWRGAASSPPPAGAAELQDRDPNSLTELGEVLEGLRPGRRDDADLTVFKSTGLGVEDAVVGWALYRAAQDRGIGSEVSW